MKKKHRITLKELSKHLNLSASTVSRALNDHPDINIDTKSKVQKLAKQLNYHPNIFARGFRQHKTNIIGVIVPKISSNFNATMLEGILEKSEYLGYKIIVSESENKPEKQTEMLQTMTQFGVDGILLSLSKNTNDIEFILDTIEQIPLVLFDKVSSKIPCTQVMINEEQAAFKAVEHLIQLGKKRIAILKETENTYTSKQRFKGYLRALETHKIDADEQLILDTEDISIHQGKRLTNKLLSLKNPPDGIFAITDDCAIGVIKTLLKYNIKIPEEIAVIGFSNSYSSTIISPKLSTIDQPGHKIGEIALEALITEIKDESNDYISNKSIEVKTNLIVRESTLILNSN